MAPIIIVPIGKISPDLIIAVQARIQSVLGVEVRPGPAQPIPTWAYEPRRRQFRAEAFIPLLRQVTPSGQAKVLGITAVDLYVPRLNFVFGVADRIPGVAVISLCRLDQRFYGRPADFALLKQRAGVEAIHELGHLFGLEHCPRPDCVMFFSNCLADTDQKADTFCSHCKRRLERKLQPQS